jgi:hypothetical protein
MSQLLDFVAAVEAQAKAELVKIETVAMHFLQDVVGGVEAELKTYAPMAINLVLAEAPKLISGEEKFGNAVTHLIQAVEGDGAGIVPQTAQMMIQAAYKAAQELATTL